MLKIKVANLNINPLTSFSIQQYWLLRPFYPSYPICHPDTYYSALIRSQTQKPSYEAPYRARHILNLDPYGCRGHQICQLTSVIQVRELQALTWPIFDYFRHCLWIGASLHY